MTQGNKLYFVNPGEVDIRAVTTLGVNVKPEGGTPIGQFGTGLKYAIAGVLRLGGKITVWSGEKAYVFHALTEDIRGKDFGIVHMSSVDGDVALGFTTDLGAHWEPWQLYRELRSNALDEGGDVETFGVPLLAGTTVVEVDCEALAEAHQQREAFWLDPEFQDLLWEGHGLQVFRGMTTSLFYHGIRASDDRNSKTADWNFKFNLTGSHRLTEDRTFADFYEVRATIGQALARCDNRELLEQLLASEPESLLDYDHYHIAPSAEFVETTLDLIRRKVKVSASARAMVDRAEPEELAEAELDIPTGLAAMIEREPKVETQVRASKYDWEFQMEERMKELQAQATYWRACALKLGAG